MSLNKQLSWGLAISLVILLALQWAVISFVFNSFSEKQLISRLNHDNESLLAGVDFDTQGRLVSDAQRVNMTYQRPLSGHYYVIATNAQRLVSRSLWDANLNTAIQPPGTQATYKIKGPESQTLLVVARGFRKQEHELTIAVAEDLTPLDQALYRFQWLCGAISLSIMLILLLVQRKIVADSLKPLQKLNEDMQQLEAGKTSQIQSAGPSEIAPLIAEFNRLLNLMGNQSRRSREALGNLAHALRTQLTILNQTIDQAGQQRNTQVDSELKDAIREATEVMRHIVERELKRARLIGSTLPGRRINVSEEVTIIVKTLQLMYVAKLPIIHVKIDAQASFMGDQEDFTELLGNLFDNACKWCQQHVELTIKQQQGLIILMEDDGPGCAIEQLESLTQRGFRLDETVPGSGLGLAIVRDIVESYGGTLSFDQSLKYGGLQVCVWLPEKRKLT